LYRKLLIHTLKYYLNWRRIRQDICNFITEDNADSDTNVSDSELSQIPNLSEEEEEERWLNGEERWLNGSAPDCKSVVLGSNPAPPQHTANSVSPEVGSHLG
jgi:hypothetical protein